LSKKSSIEHCHDLTIAALIKVLELTAPIVPEILTGCQFPFRNASMLFCV